MNRSSNPGGIACLTRPLAALGLQWPGQRHLGSEAYMKILALVALAATLVGSCTAPVPPARSKSHVVQAELDRLAGTWVLVGGYLDGKPIADDDVKKAKITWAGNKISTFSPHIWRDAVVATLHVDPTTRPGTMDIVYEATPGPPALAIYEWLGPDRYRICIDRRGHSRPEEFVSVPGTGQSLHVWQRQK
jgi:uncharacterized protein (TIGR03067 family)